MIELTDWAVDDTYRHGIADLIAHAPGRATVPRQRRVALPMAIAGVAIPLAALALAAIVVIAGHAQRSTSPANAVVKTAPLGNTIGIGATVVPATSVTVEKVVFIPAGSNPKEAPANGLFAVVDVDLLQQSGGPRLQRNAQEAAALSAFVAQLQLAQVDNDVARATALKSIIAIDQIQLSRDTLALMPFSFEYVASDGESYAAWDGNSAEADLSSIAVPDFSVPDLTSIEVVFDVGSSGGVIQLIDSLGRVVGRWQAPAE
jgi:hypothetical protein